MAFNPNMQAPEYRLWLPEKQDKIGEAINYLKQGAEMVEMGQEMKEKRKKRREDEEMRRAQKELAQSFRVQPPADAADMLKRTTDFFMARGKPEVALRFQTALEEAQARKAQREANETMKRDALTAKQQGDQMKFFKDIMGNRNAEVILKNLPPQVAQKLNLTPELAQAMASDIASIRSNRPATSLDALAARYMQMGDMENAQKVAGLKQSMAPVGYSPMMTDQGLIMPQTRGPGAGKAGTPMVNPATGEVYQKPPTATGGSDLAPIKADYDQAVIDVLGPDRAAMVDVSDSGVTPKTEEAAKEMASVEAQLLQAAQAAAKNRLKGMGKTEKAADNDYEKVFERRVRNNPVLKKYSEAKINASEISTLNRRIATNPNLNQLARNVTDISVIYRYIQALDDSTVRDGEVQRLQAAYGWGINEARTRLDMWLKGEPLPPGMAQEIEGVVKARMEGIYREYKDVVRQLVAQAAATGVNPMLYLPPEDVDEVVRTPGFVNYVNRIKTGVVLDQPAPATTSGSAGIASGSAPVGPKKSVWER